GVDLSAEYIVDNNLDPVMSESYGLCELGLGTTGNTYRSELWEQAAAQGITVLVASGDGGSAVCDVGEKYAQNGLSVSGFASTPYNVSVGGTDFNDLGDFSTYWSATNNPTTGASAISYIPEMTWNDSCTNSETFSFFGATTAEEVCNNYAAQSDGLLTVVGGSGGQSNCTAPTGQTATSCAGGYTKPAWQKGTGVPSDGRRDVPDVSLFASNGFNGSFYIVCQSDAVSSNSCSLNSPYLGYSFQGYGGTSVSSPAFAGIMTLVNQKYGRQGNANYVLYGLASQAGVFHDIPLGSTIAMPCGNATPDCTVNPSGDIYGVLSGYSTTTGYDLATGLGSVNVTNLVNAWPSANFIGTTTTLTIPSAAITHSTSVSFSGNVTPKSGTAVPTGFVALIAETGTSQSGEVNAGNFVLATGSCSGSPCATFSGSTNLLPGGTNYNLIAHYPGDSTFGASDSPPTLMAVNPENSETNLAIVTFNSTTNAITSSNATSFPYGSPYLLRSNVTNSSGANCVNSTTRALAYGCPTGSVTITDNGTALGPGTFPLNIEGYTEYQTIQLTGGSHNLAASYSGDKSFNPSSGSDAVTVTTAPTTTTVVALSGPAYIGSAYPFGVQTQSNSTGVAPTANYTVFDGTTPLATTISSSSPVSPQPGVVEVVASLQVTLSAPSGQHSLTVHYNGDSNYASSVSAPSTVVALYRTTVSGTANPNPVEYPGTMTVTATVSTGNPGSNASLKPTGTITMNTSVAGTQITPVSTTASLDSHGNWVLLGTATFVPQQTDTVVVNYSGDSNYGPSTAYVPITVNVPGFTISSNPSSLAMIAGQTGQATITITPLTTYTSTVALSCQELALWGETCSVSPSSVTLTNGAAATATVNVGTLAPSNSATAAIRRTRRGAIFSLPPPRDMCFGFGTITGAVALFLLALPSPRQRRQSLRRVPWFATTCILCLLAACGGGSNSGGGGGGGGGDSGPFPTATKLSASSTKIVAGASSILTATVSAQDTVTGLISFNSPSGETLFGNVNLVNGSAQTTINNPTPVGVGTFVVLAQYSGDANNLPSQSGNLSIVVTGSGVQYVMGQTATVTQETGVTLTLQ
ncbi:MAG TPA: Ig-like domain repeat protein, partial [Candidatus Cybelea sp.]|nr:Ig-like domain repeat protein [Candidatus Cybelea sp.]